MIWVGTWNQKPSRMDRDIVSLVKTKCQPAGTSLMPRNWAVVVKERRSMPQRIPGGRSRRKTEAMAGAEKRDCQVIMSKTARPVKKNCKWQPRVDIDSELFMVLGRFGSQPLFHEVTRLEQPGRGRDLTPHFIVVSVKGQVALSKAFLRC